MVTTIAIVVGVALAVALLATAVFACQAPSLTRGQHQLLSAGLATDVADEGRGGRMHVLGLAVAVPEPHRDHSRRYEFQAVEEAQDLLQRVDVDPRGGERRGEVLSFGRVAGTDRDDQVAAGDDGPGEGVGHGAGGSGLQEVQDRGEDYAGGLGQVDQFGQFGIGQYAVAVIYELIRAGRLRSVKQGRARRIPAAAIRDYIALLEREAGQ